MPLIFNGRAQDDPLRTEACRANVFHTVLSRAMKADALAQFLIWKRWDAWFLIQGERPADQAFAEALRRAADKFNGKIVEERTYAYSPTSRVTETGHVQVQRQMPVFTQDAPAWSRVHEQWAGTQMQRRFEDHAGRWMRERDYTAWLGVRALGEAVTRTNSNDLRVLRDYLRSDQFELGAFKGEALTFRTWNQQMRQPILLAAARILVSVSPQEGFLRQRTPLDSLGFDLPESGCSLK